MTKIKSTLLIDDSPAINELNKYYIDSVELSKDIHFEKNGRDALDYLLSIEKQPELIILDIKMPVMDGFDFLRQYTSDKYENENTSIILLTSSTNPTDLKNAEEFPIVKGVFEKPLNKDSINKINSLF